MNTFRTALRTATKSQATRPRRWLFVPYDQLHDGIGPLASEPADELGIVLVESRTKVTRRPYHQQKLALVLANLRHFALEQAARGVAVRHVVTAAGYAEALVPLARELGPLRVQRPTRTRQLTADASATPSATASRCAVSAGRSPSAPPPRPLAFGGGLVGCSGASVVANAPLDTATIAAIASSRTATSNARAFTRPAYRFGRRPKSPRADRRLHCVRRADCSDRAARREFERHRLLAE